MLLVLAGLARGEVPDRILSFTLGDTLYLNTPGQVTGLTWMGTDTLVFLADLPDSVTPSGRREVQLIFQDRQGRIFRQADFTGVLDRGLAYDGEFLWGCGDDRDGLSILYKIEADTLKIEEAYNTLGHRSSSLAWTGRHVWVADQDSGRLDRFDPELGDISRSVVSPGFSPCGVAWDGNQLWVTDRGTGRMYRLRGSRLNWNASVDTESFFFRGQEVLLAYDGFALWLLPPGEKLVIKINFN